MNVRDAIQEAREDRTGSGPHRASRRFVALLLALALTAAAFGIVAWGGLAPALAMATIAVLAIVQMIVHLVLFLDLGRQRTGIEVHAALLLGVVLILIMVGGTIVIMTDLAHRMMSH